MTIEVKELRINTNVQKDKHKNEKDLCNDLQSVKEEIVSECKKMIQKSIKNLNKR